MKHKTIYPVVLALLCLYVPLRAQVNTITTAVPFMMICPEAGAAGRGENGVASLPDVNAMHWNASKLAFAQKRVGLGISYTPWMRALVPDINLAYISFYAKQGRNGAFGGSMRYFSMGEITFTSVTGAPIGQFRPNEFAIDGCYAYKLSDRWSAAMTARYIHSNLTNGITVMGQDTKTGKSVAVDLSAYYYNGDVKVGGKDAILTMGMSITNIGSKMSYSTSAQKDFIPTHLRLGSGITVRPDEYNQVGFTCEFGKLLVPTPPVYQLGPNGSPLINSSGQYVIASGMDPNVSVPRGMIQSFYDAPGGFREELREITVSAGTEYWYNKLFAVRAGYFYEAPQKGNRQFLTLGAGIRYNIFGLDFAYLIPTNGQRSPLQNTLRFTLIFDFDGFRSQAMLRGMQTVS